MTADKAVVELALKAWGLNGANFKLAALRENKVFRIGHQGQTWALRLHRPGYRNNAELASELAWMQALAQADLSLPCPLACQDGHLLRSFGDQQVSILSWLDGQPLGQSGEALEAWVTPQHFCQLGKALAQLHAASDRWKPPADFQRWSWNSEGLLGDRPLWDRFWLNPALSAANKALMLDFRARARDELDQASDLDFGLIHADPVRENLLVNDGKVQLIDFDDGGWGYRLFDLATALRPNRSEPNFDALKAALIEGYYQVRPIDLSLLPLFEALRAVTYVGWIISRAEEPGGLERQARFIAQARERITSYITR